MTKRQDGKAEEIQPTSAAAPKSSRKVVLGLSKLALGLSVAALAAGISLPSGPAKAIAPVPSLGQRVNAVRALAQSNPAVTDELLRENRLIKVQWVNWPNWPNWHNWHNWGNGWWANF
jgi:hypothetical protein